MPSRLIKLWVWGEAALFSRPEMKSERVSYDVMTPSSARGILDAIYFKPAMQWEVTGIRVLSPVNFMNIRRNELGVKIPAPGKKEMSGAFVTPLGISIEENRQQRASLLLKNVSYIIEAKVKVLDPRESDGKILSDPEAKHLEIFKRRAKEGKYFHHPYFGCREFPVSFRLLEEGFTPPDILEVRDRDFGFMLQDMIYREDKKGQIIIPNKKGKYTATPHFFRAIMKDGFIEVPPLVESFS